MPHESGSAWLDRLKGLFPQGDETPSWHARDPNEPLTDQDLVLADSLSFERVEVPGTEAWQRWQQLRGGPGYAVIIGGDDMLMRTAEHMAFDERTPEEILITDWWYF